MKYIKEYEKIDFNDWEEEEEDPSIPNEFIGHEKLHNIFKSNNILYNFIKEYNKQKYSLGNCHDLRRFLNDHLKDNYKYLMEDAFDWRTSVMGLDYWYSFSIKLKYILKN